VTGSLPVRVSSLDPEEVEKAIFELSLQPALRDEEESLLMERLRRIEEKLDLILSGNDPTAPRPLGAADLECVVFSGAGLSLPVDEPCREGQIFKVEILLPGSEGRVIRSVARAVEDSSPMADGVPRHHVALSLDHMHEDDRDALVSHSYELQRKELRARDGREFRV
jgi:hypothetical protein